MSIRLYRGSLDSGMIEECIREIEADKGSEHLVIIPEHYSHEMESLMVNRFGVIGINNIKVMTPHRLAVNCLSANQQIYLTESGKEMMIVRAIKDYESREDADKKLCAIMGKGSFADSMLTLISELKRRDISCVELRETAQSVESERLANKLLAAAEIYEGYEELLSQSDYNDMDDNISRLADKVYNETPSSSRRVLADNTRVWFMRFDEYLPRTMKLIRAMSERERRGDTGSVTVCLNYVMSSDSGYMGDEAEIYEHNFSSYQRLIRLANGEDRFFPTQKQGNRAEDIAMMLEGFAGMEKCVMKSENISVFESMTPHGEISHIAEVIHSLMRESRDEYEKEAAQIEAVAMERGKELKKASGSKGDPVPVYTDEEKEILKGKNLLRYRDIGILFGGAMDYAHILDSIFSEHEIPYFADERIVMSEHPIAAQILSVFDIYENDWSYESVFAYLNAGFIYSCHTDKFGNKSYRSSLSADEVSRLDNYVSRHGIRGKRLWLDVEEWKAASQVFAETWEDSGDTINEAEIRECEEVNRILQIVREPFKGFLSEGATALAEVSVHADTVIDFLERINMYDGLRSMVAYFENESDEVNAHTIARQFSQIWNEVLHVIEQARMTMSGVEMTFIEFGEYIRAGLAKCEISTIPSSLDAVYTGTVERSTSAPVKYLFAAGAVNGTYPSSVNYDGFFSDIDRELIKDKIDLAPTKDEQRAAQRYKLYKALRAATDRLYITYPSKNSVGEAYKPSVLVTNIREMFDSVEYSNDFNINHLDEANITSRAAAKRSLLYNCASPVSKLPPAWKRVFNYFRTNGGYDREMAMIGRAASFYTETPHISPQTAHMLYDRDIEADGSVEKGRLYSASSINTYAYCPMRYFLSNGLRLNEERGADIGGDEVGTYIHKIIQTLCEEVEREAKEDPTKDWVNLTTEQIQAKISDIVSRTKDNLSEEIFDYRMRMRVMNRVEKTVRKSAVNVLNSIRSGKFRIKETELNLENTQLADGVYIRGIVDRVDIYEGKLRKHYRIIDYKSGKTGFDRTAMLNGIDMQLMIYAIAVDNYYRKTEGEAYNLSGIYYQHVLDRYISKNPQEKGKFYLAARKDLYLDGDTYLPSDVAEMQELIEAVCREENQEGANYLNFTLNKKPDEQTGIRMPSGKQYKTEESKTELVDKVKENIAGIDREIMAGTIAPHPYGSAPDCPDACVFCAYKEVCSYEREKRVRIKDSNGAEFGGEV